MSHQLGFIGLGRMGKNMVLRMREQGIDVVAYNRTPTPEASVSSIDELVQKLVTPRVIFLMVPNGSPVDEVIGKLKLSPGDMIIDGGNCYYKDTIRRAKELETKGIHYIDCGTSGGLEGARHGACLMLGGEEDIAQDLTWLWDALGTWNYFGTAGAGHFVKMVHNGVEYGMNQAIGEGFEILSKGPYVLDYAKVAHNWSHGSVVRGWLMELLAKAFDADGKLDTFEGKVGGGQTGGWTVEAAKEFGVDATVLEDALKAREKSQTKPSFSGKVVSALRAGYGGHKEPKI